MPATIGLVKAYYEGADRQRALSFWSIGSWGGSGVCSLFGGVIATYMGWRWIFILSIIIAVLHYGLLKDTPECKATNGDSKFDISASNYFRCHCVSIEYFHHTRF